MGGEGGRGGRGRNGGVVGGGECCCMCEHKPSFINIPTARVFLCTTIIELPYSVTELKSSETYTQLLAWLGLEFLIN